MTRRAPPRLATWLLCRFAFGPHRESLVGDIIEQYEEGRSSLWYHVQMLAIVVVGSATRARTHPGRLLRVCVLALAIPMCFATAGWLFMRDLPGRDWLTVLFNLGLFGYCSIGFVVLLVTITSLDEPPPLSLVESTRA